MSIEKSIAQQIAAAAAATSDPERAERNISRLLESIPADERLILRLEKIAKLFAASQFLANFSIIFPEELFSALDETEMHLARALMKERVEKELLTLADPDSSQLMKALRLFKKRYLLRITLRDITGLSDIVTAMEELTALAEAILAAALQWALKLTAGKYGEPMNSTVALIALGKLGGEDLNYSSDIDFIAVYDNDEGETSGSLNPSGILCNRISNHEFFCKTIEFLNRLLSSQTEDGIAYRVDLRLRPQGRKGDIALPLKAYQAYYESWGRTWERMVLIRARPVAGDAGLGRAFIAAIAPFVWRKTIDYTEMEEIRGLKKKIDSALTRDDIKRGYGGIREIEFFIQTFQLLFSDASAELKSWRMRNAIQALKSMKIVPVDDIVMLRDDYLYLRKIEHYLQMKEDLQTHSIPASEADQNALAKLMGYQSGKEFLTDLRIRRMQVKKMYNSLLGTEEDVHNEVLRVLEGKPGDEEISAYLVSMKVRDPEKSLGSIKGIREHMAVFKTMQERAITRDVVPELLERAFASASPDRALAGIEKLLTTYRLKTVHMTALKGQRELTAGIIMLLACSSYLTRIFLSSQRYLDTLIEEWSILKSLKEIEERLGRAIERGPGLETVLAEFRRFEEVRTGILYLSDILRIDDLLSALTHLAEAIIRAVAGAAGSSGLSVIALGKLGGGEMTFGSDLDIVFVSETPQAISTAERILKSLTTYTDAGLLYHVDTRLRPDGSRGILVNNIHGYKNYYLQKAQNWEIQALLRARQVAGDEALGQRFLEAAGEVIIRRGGEIRRRDIAAMRARIVSELSQEGRGMDIKLGPGGIEEIEFFVQFLQLSNAGIHPEILGQNTLSVLNSLEQCDLLSREGSGRLRAAYEYYRKLQTFLRLNEEDILTEGSALCDLAGKFLGHGSTGEFLDHVRTLRSGVLSVTAS